MYRRDAHVHSHETSEILKNNLPTIYIVDEEAAARESLMLLIREAGWQVEAFASAEEFLARPRTGNLGCVILDIDLPQLDGLALQEVIADRTETPVVFVTGRQDVLLTVRAMKAGAVDFLTKPVSAPAVLSAIEAALDRGRCALAQESTLRILERRHASLSPREREVLDLVVSGLLNKQVAAELGISEITVKAHRSKVMRKMVAASFADLVNMARTLHPGVAFQ